MNLSTTAQIVLREFGGDAHKASEYCRRVFNRFSAHGNAMGDEYHAAMYELLALVPEFRKEQELMRSQS